MPLQLVSGFVLINRSVTVLVAMRIYNYIILYVMHIRILFSREPYLMVVATSSLSFWGLSGATHVRRPQTFLEHVGVASLLWCSGTTFFWRILMFRWLVRNHIGL